jgi:folate-dependent tRNA-U54 methylase TrmFO/GidA
MSKARPSGCSPAVSPPPSAWRRTVRAAADNSAFGALLNHITGGHIISDDEPGKRSFQPMNVNFGLFPPLEPGAIVRPEGGGRFRGKEKAKAKKQAMARRALTDFGAWLGQRQCLSPLARRRLRRHPNAPMRSAP